MNTDKTAMQEFIEWLLQENELLMPKTKMIIVGKADSLLAKEREEMIDAWDDGCNKGYNGNPGSGESYYIKTFKNK